MGEIATKNICIIPARGGSKRIPKKNIKDFFGKPILAYPIEQAILSGIFSEIMVSTDSEEIAEVAKKYGAKVPFLRSAKNSDDHSTTSDVLIEVIDQYQKTGENFDTGCCIYPATPLLKQETLKRSYHIFLEKDADSLFPVLRFQAPTERTLQIDEFGFVTMKYPEYKNARSQDLKKSYHDAGQFYFFKIAALLSKKALWTDKSVAMVIDELEAQDIDDLEDWKLAEFKYAYHHSKKI